MNPYTSTRRRFAWTTAPLTVALRAGVSPPAVRIPMRFMTPSLPRARTGAATKDAILRPPVGSGEAPQDLDEDDRGDCDPGDAPHDRRHQGEAGESRGVALPRVDEEHVHRHVPDRVEDARRPDGGEQRLRHRGRELRRDR